MNVPLVSFCVKSYNQRRYLREALEGAFAQTYRPLEIVISDDGSTDGSWEEILRIVEEKSPSSDIPSSLTVVLNRNETNLGNLGNWEKICSLAHGELLVKADGDDISLPERTARIVEAWLADDKRAKVITHAVRTIPGGRLICGRNARWPLGAAMAWTRDCFERWPAISEDCRREFDDIVYSLRAVLLGPQLVLPEPLVRYRVGSGETSGLDSFRRPALRAATSLRLALPQMRRDLDSARERGLISREVYDREFAKLERDDCHNVRIIDLLTSKSIRLRWRIFCDVRRSNNWKGQVALLFLVLPKRLGDLLFSIILRLRG